MKKEQIREAVFMSGYSAQDLRKLASQGRISESQEDLVLIFRDMRLQDAVKVVTNHRQMKGSREDVVAFFEKTEISEATRVAAAVYICNNN